jgi:ribosomal protein S18 acetylase RimI-like enzyme
LDNLILRPYSSKEDMASLYDLAEVAYAEDYARIGRSAKAGLEREQRVAAVVSGLGRLVPALRDLTAGYVWADEGRVVSYVHFARSGLGGDRWSIETVMTHPDVQRRGLARVLILRSLETIRARGGRACVLKVRADNDPAYALYRSLGFAHVDSTVHLKRQAAMELPPVDSDASGIRIVPAGEWRRRWRDRYDLGTRAQEEKVRESFPLAPDEFRRPAYAQWLGPILMRLSGVCGQRWAVERDGCWLATLSAVRDQTNTREDELELSIDPGAEERLSSDLLATGLRWLHPSADQPVLLEMSSVQKRALRAADSLGFREIMTWHRLVLRLDARSPGGTQPAR